MLQRMLKLGSGIAIALLLSCSNSLEPVDSEHRSSPLEVSSSSSSLLPTYSSVGESSSSADLLGIAVTPDSEFATLFANQSSAVQVLAHAQVTRLLADDVVGDRHQQFIVALASGQTLKVAHNIDLANRAPIAVGDEVFLYGEYAYNDQGGVVHWTHKDPDGSHVAGWILHRSMRYW